MVAVGATHFERAGEAGLHATVLHQHRRQPGERRAGEVKQRALELHHSEQQLEGGKRPRNRRTRTRPGNVSELSAFRRSERPSGHGRKQPALEVASNNERRELSPKSGRERTPQSGVTTVLKHSASIAMRPEHEKWP